MPRKKDIKAKAYENINKALAELSLIEPQKVDVASAKIERLPLYFDRKALLDMINELTSKIEPPYYLETESMKALRLLLGVAILLDLKDVQAKILNTMVDMVREKK